MRKTVLFALLLSLAACTGDVSIIKFGDVSPGMNCSDLDSYIERQKLPFKKDGNAYKFSLDGEVWSDAKILCDKVINSMEFTSNSGSSPQHGRMYIDAQRLLLDAFRDNMLTYEEGSKVINLHNGIKLQQFIDAKSGIVTHFKITVGNEDGAGDAWKKASILLTKVGAK